MGKKRQVPNREYTDEFKVEAVRLAESIGGNQAAKRLGIPDSSMWNWLRLNRAGKLKAMQGTSGLVKPGVRSPGSTTGGSSLGKRLQVQWVIATPRLVLARAYESLTSFSGGCLSAQQFYSSLPGCSQTDQIHLGSTGGANRWCSHWFHVATASVGRRSKHQYRSPGRTPCVRPVPYHDPTSMFAERCRAAFAFAMPARWSRF